MNVNQLRDRVIELSHHGGGADSELNQRAIGWLNSAYHELLDELLPFAPPFLQVQQQVTSDGDGKALLNQHVHRLLQVADRQNGRILEIVNPMAMMAADPKGTAAGSPVRCHAIGNELRVHPAANLPLTVLYVPIPNDLVEGGEGESIVLPRTQHSGLVWGGLVWAALFERGFVSQSELLTYQRQWQQAKDAAKMTLLGSSRVGLRVQPFDLV